MIDLKDFKKIAHDKNTATLQHPKGHKITVLVSKLTPIQKEHLKRLNMHEGETEGRKEYEAGTPNQPVSADDSAPTTAAPQAYQPQPSTQITPAPVEGAGVAGSGPDAAIDPLKQEVTGLQEKRNSDIEQAKENAVSQRAFNDKRADLANQDVQNIQEVDQHTKDFAQAKDKNGNLISQVRPNAYYEDMSTGQRVGNAIGMLLAGAGGAGPQAMDFLNKQIDRNVAAQEKNFQHQNTVWHAYESLYHDKNIASSLAKVSNIDMLDGQMKLTAQRLGTAQAWANYNQAAGALGIRRIQEVGSAGQRLTSLRNGTLPPNPGPAGIAANKKPIGASDDWGDNANAMPQPINGDDSILSPNAQAAWQKAKYDPRFKDQYGKLTDEYNQAVQSQKAMDAIDEKFPALRAEATMSGNLAEHINPHAVAAIGGAAGTALGATVGAPFLGVGSVPGAVAGGAAGSALGEGIGHGIRGALGITGGQKQVQFNADKAATTKVIAAALKGTNVSSDQIQDVVDSNTPSYWDYRDPDTYEKKKKNIKDFIKQNTITGTTKAAGITK